MEPRSCELEDGNRAYIFNHNHIICTRVALYNQINTLFKTHWNKPESAVLIL